MFVFSIKIKAVSKSKPRRELLVGLTGGSSLLVL